MCTLLRHSPARRWVPDGQDAGPCGAGLTEAAPLLRHSSPRWWVSSGQLARGFCGGCVLAVPGSWAAQPVSTSPAMIGAASQDRLADPRLRVVRGTSVDLLHM